MSWKGLVVEMIDFLGWFFSCIFPATQELQGRSLEKFTFVSPSTCSLFNRVCKFLIPTWPKRRCQSYPTSDLAIRHVVICVVSFEKSTTYIPFSTNPIKATLREMV